MPLPTKSALVLIGWLADQDESTLLQVASLRGLKPSECGSLAEMSQALLGEVNTLATLRALPREQLHSLLELSKNHAPRAHGDALAACGLWNGESGSPTLFLDSAGLAALAGIDFGSPAPVVPDHFLDSPSLSLAATRAWGTVCMVEDLLDVLGGAKLGAGRESLLSATARKTLLQEVGEGYNLDLLAGLAQQAGLMAIRSGHLLPTKHAHDWAQLTPDAQWQWLATRWWADAPAWFTGTIAGTPALHWDTQGEAQASYCYPLAQLEEIGRIRESAHALGLLEEGQATAWTRVIDDGDAAAKLFLGSLPPVTTGVFAGEDLTLLATGPLGKGHRSSLNKIAQRDLGGLVPRYRLNQASLLRALHQGYPAENLVKDVNDACANPLPHAMESMITDTIRRAQDIILRSHEGGTMITTGSSERATELLIDPRLSMVGLSQHEDTIVLSPWPLERVHMALSQASHPALLEEPEHAVEQPAPAEQAQWWSGDPEPAPSVAETITTLVSGLRSAASKGVPAGVGSMIEVAVAGKVHLEVVVEMPDGSLVTFVMEPRALGGGRLRGVELSNATERTLPVSRIRSVQPIES